MDRETELSLYYHSAILVSLSLISLVSSSTERHFDGVLSLSLYSFPLNSQTLDFSVKTLRDSEHN